jgi:hypothetical protein
MEQTDSATNSVPVVTRRRATRVKVRLPVVVQSTFHTQGVLQNLSRTGCAIECGTYYHVGEQIVLVFALPISGELRVRAVVRWATVPLLGAEFCSGQKKEENMIGTYVAGQLLAEDSSTSEKTPMQPHCQP